MRLTLVEPAVPQAWTDRRLADPDSGDGDSGERAVLVLPLTAAEAQGIALTEALAWAGVALWGGGLVWLVTAEVVDRWSRRHAGRREVHQPPVRTYLDAS